MQYIKKKQFEDQDENRQGGIYGGLSYLSPQKSYFSPQVVQQDPNTNQAQQSLVNPVRPPTNTANQNNGIGGNSVDNNFSFSKFTNGRDSVFNPSAIFEKNSGIIRKREDILNDRVKKATEVENIPLAPNRQVEVLTPNQIIMLSSDAAKGDQKAQKRLTDFFNTTKEKGITYDSSKDKGEVATLTNSPIFGSGEEGTNYGLLDYGVSEGLIKGKNERAAEEANKNIQMNADKAAEGNKKIDEINSLVSEDSDTGRGRKESRENLDVLSKDLENTVKSNRTIRPKKLDENGNWLWNDDPRRPNVRISEKNGGTYGPDTSEYDDPEDMGSLGSEKLADFANMLIEIKGRGEAAKTLEGNNWINFATKEGSNWTREDAAEALNYLYNLIGIRDKKVTPGRLSREFVYEMRPKEKEPKDIDPQFDPSVPEAMRRKLRMIDDAIRNPPHVRGLGPSVGVAGWAGGTADRPNWHPYSIEYDPPYGIIDQIIDSVRDRIKSYSGK